MNEYSLQQVSNNLCISKETLRYYDKIGLIIPIRRENRYRVYTQDNIHDLMYVQVMKYAGFSLSEIKCVLSNRSKFNRNEETTCDTLELLCTKKTETLHKMRVLKSIVNLIDTSIHILSGKTCASEMDELVVNTYHSIQIGGKLDV